LRKGDRAPKTAARPQVTIGQITVAIAVIAVALATLVRASGSGVIVFFASLLVGALLSAIPLVAKVPYRFRIKVELITLVVLLAVSAVVWRPPFLMARAVFCEDLARQAEQEAARSVNPRTRNYLLKEATWFTRRAAVLRGKALWYGLIYGPLSPRDAMPLENTDVIHEFGVLEVIESQRRGPGREDGPGGLRGEPGDSAALPGSFGELRLGPTTTHSSNQSDRNWY
jgi:hypothetical protein